MNDEQRKAFEEWADDKYVLHKDHDGDYMYTGAKCAFEAWQVAQQVKSLEFVKTGDYDNSTPPVEHYSATTEFGIIELIVDGDGAVRAGFLDSIVYDRDFTTLTKAIEAANEDYRKRALSCLVHGGV